MPGTGCTRDLTNTVDTYSSAKYTKSGDKAGGRGDSVPPSSTYNFVQKSSFQKGVGTKRRVCKNPAKGYVFVYLCVHIRICVQLHLRIRVPKKKEEKKPRLKQRDMRGGREVITDYAKG